MPNKTLTFETPFDTYKASKVIGEGGAGRVYEVTNGAGELFALKCLAAVRITKDRLKRFKNEVEFCQRCDHVNIVRVLDAGTTFVEGGQVPLLRYETLHRYSPYTHRAGTAKRRSASVFANARRR